MRLLCCAEERYGTARIGLSLLDYVELWSKLCLWMTAVTFVNQFRHGI